MAKKLKWGTIEYLNTLIDEYFELANNSESPDIPTIAGLQIHLKISDETWKYYISERWRTHRKSEEETEEIEKGQDARYEAGAFEELMEISEKSYIDGCNNVEDDNIKEQVSASLKKAKQRIDAFVSKTLFTARNPAGAIFYAKSALGYRETAPEVDSKPILPPKIVINILPAPVQPVIEATTTYSIEAVKDAPGENKS